MPNAEPTQRLASAAKTIEKETHVNVNEARTETSGTENPNVDHGADAHDATSSKAPGQQFVGQWNQLVSTTNWDKGQIILQWRKALIEADAPAAEYSDEAWAQLVGGVTSQHVGRLRRVYQKFENTFSQYPQLFWSHFQAALDWDDAEMWLEGAIQQKWSVSQMRGKRWETVGKPGEPLPEEPAAEIDNGGAEDQPEESEITGSETSVNSVGDSELKASEREESASKSDDEKADDGNNASQDDAEVESMSPVPKQTRERLSVEVGELPDDLADAFEAFKLAIISQRRVEWSETSVETVLECLDALKQLAEAPLD